MKITQKEMVEKEVTVDVFCNKCGGSCKRYEGPGFAGLIEKTVRGDGPTLMDLTNYTFSLCEDCLDKLFKTFKIQVHMQDHYFG